VFVNRCMPAAPPGTAEALDRVAPADLAGVLRRALAWQAVQEHGIGALEAELFVHALRLPRLRAAGELARCQALDPYVAEVA
jgi:hypothetical protein